MKLAIRMADKIVGLSIVLALGLVVVALFLLGSNNRWFSKDYAFLVFLDSAAGVSANMAVQHRGFSIGQVRSVRLTEDDRVEVSFVIFDTFIDRAREGSIVEIVASPIPIGGLGGNQFLFVPGLGSAPLPEGSAVPLAGSREAKRLEEAGLARPRENGDDVSAIVGRLASLLLTLNEAVEGTDATALGRTMENLSAVTERMKPAVEKIGEVAGELKPAAENIKTVSAAVAKPGGEVMSLLEGEGETSKNLAESLAALSGTLRNLEETTAYFPGQLPQLTEMLRRIDGILVSIGNNPLLRRGIPERPEAGPGGTFDRDMEF